MSIIKRENGNRFSGMPTFFNDFFTRDLWNWGLDNYSNTGTTIPAVNIKETNDNFEVEMAAPGMKKGDFKVELDGNMLTITSEDHQQHEQTEDEKYTRREFSYQSFMRSFQLPKDVVDEERIEAKYDNGVLKLVIPKREHARNKPPKMIRIA